MKIIIKENQLQRLIHHTITENEEEIPADVMRSIEAEVDGIIMKRQQEREDLVELIRMLEDADKKQGDGLFKSLLNDKREALNALYVPNKEKLVKDFIDNYKIKKEYEQEREERRKTAQLTSEQIINVFVDAIEGGSNHWYYILDVPKEIKNMTKNGMYFSEACGKHVLNGGELAIYDIEEVGNMKNVDEFSKDKPEPLGYINMNSLLDAINIMKKDYPEHYSNIVMDEYDSEDADVFFQIATMGDVVFG